MVSQVVVRKHETSAPVFEAVSNRDSQPPLSFEDSEHDVHVPRLGSEDLLRIAAYARSINYYVDGFLVLGRHGAPLGEGALQTASEGLVKDLGGGPAFAAARFARDYPGHFVAGVDLTTPEMYTVRLRRLGVVETDNPALVLAFLKSAWERVHFA